MDEFGSGRCHLVMLFPGTVLGFMRRLWPGRDRHFYTGADLDLFGIADGRFGGARSLQICELIVAAPPSGHSHLRHGCLSGIGEPSTARRDTTGGAFSTATVIDV